MSKTQMHFFTWHKGFFDSNYQLFAKGEIKGSLVFSSWKNNARGIAKNNYYFTSEGFLNPVTYIRNEQHEQIGVIHYNLWKLTASLNLQSGEQASWRFTNSWLSQWTITNFTDKTIQYHSNNPNGTATSNTDDELMLLSGLFICGFFVRAFLIVLMIFVIPIVLRSC